MDVRWVTGFLDSPSRGAEAFWVAVTGWSLSARRGPGGAFATLVPPVGDACLRVQVVGSPPARVHLDLHVVDVEAAAGEVVAAGAAVVARPEPGLVVVRSPAGLVFCLVAWEGERVMPSPPVLEQFCLDVPGADFVGEAGFWAVVTGWGRCDLGDPDFVGLAGRGGRLLVQRVGSPAAGMHLDLGCDDVEAEVRRHVGWGASVVRRGSGGWVTLADPVGRHYCVALRSPWPESVGAT